MGVKGGKRPEAGFPRGKVDVLRGASFVTDWRFSRLNQLSSIGFGRRARLRFMSKKWEWVKTGLRGNRKRTRRPKSYVLRLNRFLMIQAIKNALTLTLSQASDKASCMPIAGCLDLENAFRAFYFDASGFLAVYELLELSCFHFQPGALRGTIALSRYA